MFLGSVNAPSQAEGANSSAQRPKRAEHQRFKHHLKVPHLLFFSLFLNYFLGLRKNNKKKKKRMRQTKVGARPYVPWHVSRVRDYPFPWSPPWSPLPNRFYFLKKSRKIAYVQEQCSANAPSPPERHVLYSCFDIWKINAQSPCGIQNITRMESSLLHLVINDYSKPYSNQFRTLRAVLFTNRQMAVT